MAFQSAGNRWLWVGSRSVGGGLGRTRAWGDDRASPALASPPPPFLASLWRRPAARGALGRAGYMCTAFDADSLSSLSYRELQALARRHGVRANQKAPVLTASLRGVFSSAAGLPPTLDEADEARAAAAAAGGAASGKGARGNAGNSGGGSAVISSDSDDKRGRSGGESSGSDGGMGSADEADTRFATISLTDGINGLDLDADDAEFGDHDDDEGTELSDSDDEDWDEADDDFVAAKAGGSGGAAATRTAAAGAGAGGTDELIFDFGAGPERYRVVESAVGGGGNGGSGDGDGWETFYLDAETNMPVEGGGGGGASATQLERDARMDARIKAALQDRVRLADEVVAAARPADFGFAEEEKIDLTAFRVSAEPGRCPGCGADFQAEDEGSPGFLPPEKLAEMQAAASAAAMAAITGLGRGSFSGVLEAEALEEASRILELQEIEAAATRAGNSEDATLAREAAAAALAATAGAEAAAGSSDAIIGDTTASGGGSGKMVVCQRCHKLRHYGEVEDRLRPGFSDHTLLTPRRFQALLTPLRHKKCLIVCLVDIFDFGGSFLDGLPQIAGDNLVMIAANKADLLPRDMQPERVRVWIKEECRRRGMDNVEARDVHLLSCKTGNGVAPLMRRMRETALRLQCDIYVIGAANVGKSSFINHLLKERGARPRPKAPPPVPVSGGGEEDGGSEWGSVDDFASLASADSGGGSGGDAGGKRGSARRKGARGAPLANGLTTSNVPGTTLGFLKIDFGDGSCLYDTPGLILPHQLTSRLTNEELKAVIPQKTVDHVTFRIAAGKTVLIGGLARVELVSGLPFLVTFFVGNDIKLHVTDAARADDFLQTHIGKLVFPPYTPERLAELGPMEAADFAVAGAGWRRAAVDIVLGGLGWVSLTGAGDARIRVTAPRGVMVAAREPLMPFEARETTAKFTGSQVVKKGNKKQGRRK